jgi:hypothetical protein
VRCCGTHDTLDLRQRERRKLGGGYRAKLGDHKIGEGGKSERGRGLTACTSAYAVADNVEISGISHGKNTEAVFIYRPCSGMRNAGMKSHVMASFPGRVGFVGGCEGMREGELLEKFPLDPFKTFWGKYRGFVCGKRL